MTSLLRLLSKSSVSWTVNTVPTNKQERDVQQEREGASSDYLGLSGTIWTIWRYLALSGTIGHYLGLSRTIWDNLGQFRTLSNNL